MCMCVCLSVCVHVCLLVSVCQPALTVFDLQWRFLDLEQQMSSKQARDRQLLKLLKDTEAENRGKYVLMNAGDWRLQLKSIYSC